MTKIFVILSVLTYTMIDLALSLALYMYFMKEKNQILNELHNFSFSSSTVDLVLLSILRCSILFGLLIGFCYNKNIGVLRLKKYRGLSVYYGCGQALYIVIKLLFHTDSNDKNTSKQFWILFAITLISSLAFYCCWSVLCKINCKQIHTHNDSDSNERNVCDTDNLDSGQIVLELLKTAKPDLVYFFTALSFLIICAVSQTVVPYYTGMIVNNLILERNSHKFYVQLLSLTLVSLLGVISAGLRAGLFRFVLGRYKLRLQHSLFSNLMYMEISFFDGHKTGELTSRLSTDCTKVADGISINLNIFLRCSVKVFVILFFMFELSWQLSSIVLVALTVSTVASDHFGNKLKDLSEEVQTSLAFANSSAVDALTSIKTVRSFAAEGDEIDRYHNLLEATRAIMRKQCFVTAGYRWSVESTNLVMTLIILYFGGHMVLNGKLSGGVLISFILYVFQLTYAVLDIGTVYTGLMDMIGASKGIFTYTKRKPLVEMKGKFVSDSGMYGHIEFKDVSFAYPTREDVTVLNDVSFTATKGEVVALVGPSGGGKSSVINLLQHFYEPKQGEILIDGISVKDYDHNFLHEKMSLVQQEPILFARTVFENIKYGLKSEVSESDVKYSAELANAHSFISSMPNEYNTQTGEKGVQFSGGEKQRIAIARALIRNPAILLLDEATSALDSVSEHLVQQAINKNLIGRTVIIIAHRLSTVERADRIIVIEKGKIVEFGKHQELMDKHGTYASLVQKQLLHENETSQ